MTVSERYPDRNELDAVLNLVHDESRRFLGGLDNRAVRSPKTESIARRFTGPLPEHGPGAVAALRELLERSDEGWVATSGPRYYHSGAFDPITAMGKLAREYGAWLHVDGAFGLFAATSERATTSWMR